MARFLTVGLCLYGGATAAALEDDSVLVQAGVRSHQQQQATAGTSYGRAGLLEKLVSQQSSQQSPASLGLLVGQFDCHAHPKLCEYPFGCGSVSGLDFLSMPTAGMAPGGKPNFKMWCASTEYEDYMHKCVVEKDLVAAGKIQYQWSLDQKNGVDEMDASYCFIEGHCSNEAVTNKTTVEEGIQMCDDRYGRKGWSELLSMKNLPQVMTAVANMPPQGQFYGGFHDTRVTTLFLKAACAMGNYHCDVVYCKETYCKNPYYVKKYSHLLPKAPGHLLQSRDWLE